MRRTSNLLATPATTPAAAPAVFSVIRFDLASPQRLRSALAIVAGVGFAIFLFALAHAPFAGAAGSSRVSER